MATAPDGLTRRAELIINGDLRVSVTAVDEMLRDLSGFDDGPKYFDGLLDYRSGQAVEEIFRPLEVE